MASEQSLLIRLLDLMLILQLNLMKIKLKKIKLNQNLQSISKNIIYSNSGEAIIIKSDSSKGILLRGYESIDFSKLKIFDNELFLGNNEILKKNYISIGKELKFYI